MTTPEPTPATTCGHTTHARGTLIDGGILMLALGGEPGERYGKDEAPPWESCPASPSPEPLLPHVSSVPPSVAAEWDNPEDAVYDTPTGEPSILTAAAEVLDAWDYPEDNPVRMANAINALRRVLGDQT